MIKVKDKLLIEKLNHYSNGMNPIRLMLFYYKTIDGDVYKMKTFTPFIENEKMVWYETYSE